MAVKGTRAADLSSWRMGLSAYKRTPQNKVPSSIAQIINSENIVCNLLKEIYGHAYHNIEKVHVYREASSDIKGNLSENGRLRVVVKLVGGGDFVYHWFVKIMPLNHRNDEVVAKFDVFRNEIEFYSKIAPALVAFLKESNVSNEDIQFDIPELLFAQENDNRAIIVLPDLIHEGFKQARDEHGNRYLSEEKATLAVESLAKVHATSYAMQMKKQLLLDRKHPSLVDAGALWTHSDMTSRLIMMKDVFCEFLKLSNKTESSSLLNKFKTAFNSEEVLKRLCIQRCSQTPDSIMCLQHGDFHFNNLLFKEEGGQLKVKIVDWQLTYSGRSAGDISYLLMSSLDPQLKKETIKKKYFESFCKTLDFLDMHNEKNEITSVLDKDYENTLLLGFFFSCGNVMQEEKENNQQQNIWFSYQLCKEASRLNLI